MTFTPLKIAAAVLAGLAGLFGGGILWHQANAEPVPTLTAPEKARPPLPAAVQAVPVRDAKADKVDPKKELEKLKGAWLVEKMEADGTAVPANVATKLKNEFAGEKLTQHGSVLSTGNSYAFRAGMHESEFSIDPNKKPKEIDIKLNENKTVLGIYHLDGDNLKLCLGFNNERPKEFTTKDQNGVILLVMKREKQ